MSTVHVEVSLDLRHRCRINAGSAWGIISSEEN